MMLIMKSLIPHFRALFNYIAAYLKDRKANTVWSELPDDVLDLILKRLSLRDYRQCRSVCVSWRRVAQKPHPHPPTNELPWLMLSELEHSETRSFFSLSKGRVCTIKLPGFRGSRCCGSSQGWLVMVSVMPNGFPTNFLLNPISGAQIQLPSQEKIPFPIKHSSIEKKILCSRSFIKKAVLSSAPTHDNIAAGNCVVVGIVQCDESRNLAFCRPGDEKWSLFDIKLEKNYILYRDVLYCNQQFYALDFEDKLTVCEFGPHPKTIRLDIPPAIQYAAHHIIRNEIHYLVESSGELLLIVRICPYHFRRDVVSTKAFQIFKFDASAMRWVEVERLDDCALFLGKNNFISLAASQYQGLIRGNCIYLTGCNNEFGHYECKHWYRDSAMFCLDDRTIKPYFPSDRNSYYKSPPIWIMLNPW